jgi:hypothetical protein
VIFVITLAKNHLYAIISFSETSILRKGRCSVFGTASLDEGKTGL